MSRENRVLKKMALKLSGIERGLVHGNEQGHEHQAVDPDHQQFVEEKEFIFRHGQPLIGKAGGKQPRPRIGSYFLKISVLEMFMKPQGLTGGLVGQPHFVAGIPGAVRIAEVADPGREKVQSIF